MIMKRQMARILFVGLMITFFCAACRKPADTPALSKTSILPETSASSETLALPDMPASLVCREHTDDSMSWTGWPRPSVLDSISPWWTNWRRSTMPHGISRNGLVSDGELLWLSTIRGVIRLNVRTWECDLFTTAAEVSLVDAYPLLPDQDGSLWVGVRGGIVRFFDGQWQVIYQIPDGRSTRLSAMGWERSGDLCVQIFSDFGLRIGTVLSQACLKSAILPMHNTPFTTSYNDDGSEDCGRWKHISGWRYNYSTQAACKQIQRMELYRHYPDYDAATVSPDGGDVWMAQRTQAGDRELLHWRDEAITWDQAPYRSIHALAVDPVHGGVWMATEDGLVHAWSESGTGSSTQAVHSSARALPSPNLHDEGNFSFQPLSLHLGRHANDTSALAVDQDDRVWAVTSDGVLRYDEAVEGWRLVEPVEHCITTIAADPVRGVWVAKCNELLYLDGEQRYSWPKPGDYENSPTALLAVEGGSVWMGTLYNGVWMAKPDTGSATVAWRKFTDDDGLTNGLITALARGPDGRIYAAHHEGISIFDPAAGVTDGRWSTLPGSQMSETAWANAIAFGPPQAGGELWMGHHFLEVVHRYRDGVWTDHHFKSIEDWGYSINALLVDAAGSLWIGTPQGLYRQTSAEGSGELSWQMVDENDVATREVLAMVLDARGRVWVGGTGGISMWEGGR